MTNLNVPLCLAVINRQSAADRWYKPSFCVKQSVITWRSSSNYQIFVWYFNASIKCLSSDDTSSFCPLNLQIEFALCSVRNEEINPATKQSTKNPAPFPRVTQAGHKPLKTPPLFPGLRKQVLSAGHRGSDPRVGRGALVPVSVLQPEHAGTILPHQTARHQRQRCRYRN
jgi:hypothetical protein